MILRVGGIRLSDDVVADREDLLQYAINILLKHLRQAGGVAGVKEEGFNFRGAAVGRRCFGDAQAGVVVAVVGDGAPCKSHHTRHAYFASFSCARINARGGEY